MNGQNHAPKLHPRDPLNMNLRGPKTGLDVLKNRTISFPVGIPTTDPSPVAIPTTLCRLLLFYKIRTKYAATYQLRRLQNCCLKERTWTEFENYCLSGCDAVWAGSNLPAFWRNLFLRYFFREDGSKFIANFRDLHPRKLIFIVTLTRIWNLAWTEGVRNK